MVRCISAGVPRIGSGGSGDPLYGYFQIVQSPGFVVRLMEVFHDARIIPLDGRPHLSRTIHQSIGDSRGRWDGETLVVDSTNFSSTKQSSGIRGEPEPRGTLHPRCCRHHQLRGHSG